MKILLFKILCLLTLPSINSWISGSFNRKRAFTLLYNREQNNFPNIENKWPYPNKYPISKKYYELYIKRLNSKNITIQNEAICNNSYQGEEENNLEKKEGTTIEPPNENKEKRLPELKITIEQQTFTFENVGNNENDDESNNDDDDDEKYNPFLPIHNRNRKNPYRKKSNERSENFEISNDFSVTFKDVGGYEDIKEEMLQCVDMLKNYQKYKSYNVRVPNGLILEGPPGNGKTLLAKSLAGEVRVNFIAISGSQFQEKYVGVGSSRVRELFKLASKNTPCIIFIDEIDALGRTRSSDGESSTSERDNTLNELLVGLDGFKETPGVFLIGATNRIDLLDPALVRPGRIDKSIFVGPPNTKTREFIINIHLRGKPYNKDSISRKELIEITRGLSGAEIENLLNEAMLMALRNNRKKFLYEDIDNVINRMLAGWQSSTHEFTEDMINHISVHEFGHVLVGLLCDNHSKIKKVTINPNSPKSPAYTLFEKEDATIYTKQSLFEHLMILLAGRIAENEIYGSSFVSTGASNDFKEATQLAEQMIMYYGMGNNTIYPSLSETYREMIDNDVFILINDAYHKSSMLVSRYKLFILKGSEILKMKKVIYLDELKDIFSKYI